MPKKGIKPQLYRRIGIMCAYVFRLVLGDEVSRLAEQGKGPVTFLMDNPRELPSVIAPFRTGFLCKALYTPKCHILYSYLHRTNVSEEIRTAACSK